jgi:hypothetical protein
MWMLLLSVSGRLFHRWFAVLKVRWLRVSESDWKTVPDCICFISRVELGGSHGTLPQFVAILTADVDIEEHTEVGAETKFRGLNRCELFTFTRLNCRFGAILTLEQHSFVSCVAHNDRTSLQENKTQWNAANPNVLMAASPKVKFMDQTAAFRRILWLRDLLTKLWPTSHIVKSTAAGNE